MIDPDTLQNAISENCTTALKEDIGSGDLTAIGLQDDRRLSGRIVAKSEGVLCGVRWFEECFRQLDPQVHFIWGVEEGSPLETGQEIVRISATIGALLSGERTALNFLELLSATAAASREAYVRAQSEGITVYDTRKTIPGLRIAQKYAVWVGGCSNNRFGLWDAYMIKENHITAYGSLKEAIKQTIKAREIAIERFGVRRNIIVEVENLEELKLALQTEVDSILLDNFSKEDLQTIKLLWKTTKKELEVSGQVSVDDFQKYGKFNVNRVSMGSLTKRVTPPDFSMRLMTEFSS